MSEALYLVELAAYDIGGASTTTLRYANRRGHVTGPAETPANTVYRARIAQPITVARAAFRPGATSGRSVIGTGELLLHNADGALDALLTDYALDGRTLTLRRGTEGAAYPGGFTTVGVYTMEQAEVDGDMIRVRVKSPAFALDAALQATVYAGDNVAPDGLEGTADDLKGKPKPWAAGVIRNATLPCVNEAKLIYQMHDGAVQSVDEVFDAGRRLGVLAPFAWANANGTTGGYSAATDGATIVTGGLSGGNPAIRTTTDGVTYSTIGSLPFVSSGTAIGMAYSPSLDRFCTVTNNATGEIATSDDAGATWQIRTAAAAVAFNRVRWDARRSLFVAVAAGGAIHTSPTGVTWTAQTSGTASALLDVATDGPLLVAVGAAGVFCTSADGTTWVARTLGATQFVRAWYTGSAFLIATGATIYRSLDGLQWSAVYTSAPNQTTQSLNAAEGWAVASHLDSVTGYSSITVSPDDGLTWQAVAGSQTALLSPVEALTMGERWYVVYISGTDRSGIPGTFGSLADLEDDDLAPVPGTFKSASNAAGSYVRLGSPPYGAVTADFTVGATAADRTAAQVWADILTKAGYTSADWVAGDLTTLDAADNSEVGVFLGTEDRPTIAEALDMVANTVGAWWGPRASDGDFRLVQWLAPSGTPALELGPNDIVEGSLKLLASTDEGRGLPSTKTTLRYAPNWTPQVEGLAAGVTDARRVYLAQAWREVFAEDAAVATAHLLAPQTVEDTLFVVEADAQAEATRRQALRGVWRQRYEVVVALTAARAALDLGDVVTLTHPRYGLSAGVDCRILGIVPDAARDRLTLTLWG